jgi:hypothetical protein
MCVIVIVVFHVHALAMRREVRGDVRGKEMCVDIARMIRMKMLKRRKEKSQQQRQPCLDCHRSTHY